MSLNNHTFFQDQIQSGRKLTHEEQAALTEHLAGCPECRQYAAFHRQLSEALPALYPTVQHSPKDIRAKAGRVQQKLQRRRRTTRFIQNALSLSAAATALVLLLVIFRSLPYWMPIGQPASDAGPAAAATARLDDDVPAQKAMTTTAADTPPPPPSSTRAAQPPATGLTRAAPTATVAIPEITIIPSIPSVARDGQTAYLGTGNRLIAVDISQPEAPQWKAESQELPGRVLKVLPLPNAPGARVVVSAGRYLVVLSTDTPGDLGFITQSKLPGPIYALILDISTNRLYAGGALNSDSTKGFVVIMDPSPADTLDLLGTIQLEAPVQSLALTGSTLFVAHNGGQPKVTILPVGGDQFGAPQDLLFPGTPVYSMTITGGDTLVIGSAQKLVIYRVTAPLTSGGAWLSQRVDEKGLPGLVLGFELRPTRIYAAGKTLDGKRFQQIIALTQSVQSGSVVDGASYVSVGDGLMLTAGDPLEIYSILDPEDLPLLGTYPQKSP